jgi:hypothetical protein
MRDSVIHVVRAIDARTCHYPEKRAFVITISGTLFRITPRACLLELNELLVHVTSVTLDTLTVVDLFLYVIILCVLARARIN